MADNQTDIRTVSVFSGAGGFDIGAITAGAHVIWANDMMKEACMTYRTNIGDHIVCGDIYEKMKELEGLTDISLVIGGPLIHSMRDLGYSVNFMVLNAKDFDVPQARERIFIVGFRGDSAIVPDLYEMMEPYRKPAKALREVLLTLDKAGTGNNQDVCRAKITLAQHPVLRKTPYAGMIFTSCTNP